jgi:hypothetical protein
MEHVTVLLLVDDSLAVRMVMERWASFRAAPHESPTLVRADLTLDQRELAAKGYEPRASRKGESVKAGRQ